MFKKYLIIFIDILLLMINWIISAISLFIDYTVKLWRNNIMRKIVIEFMIKIIKLFHSIRNYLEYVKNNVTFRILYKKVTLPMEVHYKELKRRNG